MDPINAGEPINSTVGISAGTSFDFKDDSRLSLFGTASFNRGFEYREGPLVDFTNLAKRDFPNSQEYEYSTSTTAMGSAFYKINDNHKLKYTLLYKKYTILYTNNTIL
jgi:hypothetical protein